MLKRWVVLTFLVGNTILAFAQANNIGELRQQYLKALHDCEYAPSVYQKFQSIEDPTAQMLAYKGALEAIMTKTTWNVFKKLSYLRSSEASFQEAIRLAPNNVEIRFMRMAVQYEIPEYLGYSDDMEDDRKFIVDHIEEFNPAEFSYGTLTEIFGFMKKCGRFTSEQIEKFKGILALKN